MPTILITGANRGLGLEHAKRYAERGWTVMACRRAQSDAAALNALAEAHEAVSEHDYDAADPNAPAQLKAELGARPIDVLFNNAGMMGPRGAQQSLDEIAPDQIAETIAINALAPLALSQALIDNVAASERKIIVNQSSLMGSLGDNGSGGYYAYRTSKAALNMLTRSLAHDVAARGVIAAALHPGWVRTDMGGSNATLSVEESVEGQQAVIDGLNPERSGGFFNYDGRALPW